jgi:hypothetical protein
LQATHHARVRELRRARRQEFEVRGEPTAQLSYAARRMVDDPLPKPEPKEIDEKLSLQLRHLAEDAVLKGEPYGDERCDNCLYYLNPDDKLSYCWHPKLRILVGGSWWCQWWEKAEE